MKDSLLEREETPRVREEIPRRRSSRAARMAQRRKKRRQMILCGVLAAALLSVCAYGFLSRKEEAPDQPPASDAGLLPGPGTAVQPDSAGVQPVGSDTVNPGQIDQPPQVEDPAFVPTVNTVSEDPLPFDEEKLDVEVERILGAIVTSDMTKLEQARAVFDFTKTGIRYTGDSDKSDWRTGAYEGLTTRKGDCFTYYAVSRALLTGLGIDNLEIQRLGGPTSHFWNLVDCGDGWYHFDATPRSSKMPAFESFMFTDEEAAEYTRKAGREYYTFDSSLYPPRAGSAEAEYAGAEGGEGAAGALSANLPEEAAPAATGPEAAAFALPANPAEAPAAERKAAEPAGKTLPEGNLLVVDLTLASDAAMDAGA